MYLRVDTGATNQAETLQSWMFQSELHMNFLPKADYFLYYLSLSSSWLSDGQFCRVVEDSGNYVECACSHLSVYTAHAQMASLASYNEAFYASGFICISGTVWRKSLFRYSVQLV
jgi:hypothetical protein